MLDERRQPHRIFGRMRRMPNLQSVDPLLDQRRDALACAGLRRVRQDGKPAGAVNEIDRLAHGQLVLGNVARFAVSEIAIERVAKIGRPTLGDQCARDMWSADGAAAGLLEHRRKLDANAELVQANYHPLGAGATHLAETDEPVFELPGVGEVKSKNMRLKIDGAGCLDGAQLDPDDNTNTERRARSGSVGDAVEGIVVSQRDGGQANASRLAHDVSWCARAI